jgi:hypothetical protein
MFKRNKRTFKPVQISGLVSGDWPTDNIMLAGYAASEEVTVELTGNREVRTKRKAKEA